MKLNYIILLFITVLAACDEPVTLDPKQVDPVIVIEGLITDRETYQYVRVTETVDFYAEGGSRPITDAEVSVVDNEGNQFIFEHNPREIERLDGYYLSENPFSGKVGNTYSLSVSYSGQQYQATDQLLRVAPIDSLEVIINEDEFADPDDPNYYYEVLFYATEPQETDDYYLFKFYRNDTLILESENDIYFSDDEVLAEQIDGLPTAGFYKQGDVAVVEMYSLTNNAFVYYNDLINLLENDGGMFGSPPVNPRNNLSNGAMGYFQTSAVASDTVMIK
ncbi:DUF4249 domain-containing protein [Fulvivirga sp. RKSG066]|uniref:DUF4249 domain-containing protein n=1 Tax=Fulvivirga aurantia TaxID=2529383 RepID=UPI0012BC3DED|nr:DUF4249 domain-containing protein [Fulvivirga aurantia]MTI23036.1 DUF4249 domain-containing protein [Fulvivirga aurantia]